LATAASNFLKLRGVAGEAISGIIADLARLALQRGILSLLGSFLPGGGGLTAVASPFAGDGAGPSTFTPDYSGLPRLATGGTILAGEEGGVDKNVLSVNGVPKAMIGAHETLSVANPNLSVGANMQVARPAPTSFTVQQTVHVDARNSVNPQGFARELLSQANNYAVQVGHQAVKQSLEAMPGSLSSHVRLRG
jgi:hypothetical protein